MLVLNFDKKIAIKFTSNELSIARTNAQNSVELPCKAIKLKSRNTTLQLMPHLATKFHFDCTHSDVSRKSIQPALSRGDFPLQPTVSRSWMKDFHLVTHEMEKIEMKRKFRNSKIWRMGIVFLYMLTLY
jgi:hypothetical protein